MKKTKQDAEIENGGCVCVGGQLRKAKLSGSTAQS